MAFRYTWTPLHAHEMNDAMGTYWRIDAWLVAPGGWPNSIIFRRLDSDERDFII